MKIDRQWMLCTVKELGTWLAECVAKDVLAGEKNFPDCDFTIAGQDDGESLREMARSASGWYGIKAIDAGFDSNQLMLIADYYGGGCASMGTVGEYDEEIGVAITATILDTLQTTENAKEDTLLLVEFSDNVERLMEVSEDG